MGRLSAVCLTLLGLLVASQGLACTRHLESSSGGGEGDWDRAFADMAREQKTHEAQKKREAAVRAIERVRERLDAGLSSDPGAPEILVKILISKRFGFEFEESLPPGLVYLASRILELRLSGQVTDSEIGKAVNRSDLTAELERTIVEFIPTTESFVRATRASPRLIRELQIKLTGLNQTLQSAMVDATPGSFSLLGRRLGEFWEHCLQLSRSGPANLLNVLGDRPVRDRFRSLMHPDLPPSVVFMVRGSLAASLVALRDVGGVKLPDAVVLPFEILNDSGKLWFGLAELEAIEATGAGDGAEVSETLPFATPALKLKIEQLLSGD